MSAADKRSARITVTHKHQYCIATIDIGADYFAHIEMIKPMSFGSSGLVLVTQYVCIGFETLIGDIYLPYTCKNTFFVLCSRIISFISIYFTAFIYCVVIIQPTAHIHILRSVAFQSSLNLFFSNSKSPSSRILHSSLDIALRSTDKKSASCWRLKGMGKLALFCFLDCSDR